jgi:leucyl aminopeptidase
MSSVSAFPHTWAQTSIIVKIEPTSDKAKKEPIAIVSAHCDSTNMIPFLPSPGADDDGSGTVSILEAYRGESFQITVLSSWRAVLTLTRRLSQLCSSPSTFLPPLSRSQAVAQSYAEAGKLVKAQQQFDST